MNIKPYNKAIQRTVKLRFPAADFSVMQKNKLEKK
jgi:hypothetical protein